MAGKKRPDKTNHETWNPADEIDAVRLDIGHLCDRIIDGVTSEQLSKRELLDIQRALGRQARKFGKGHRNGKA